MRRLLGIFSIYWIFKEISNIFFIRKTVKDAILNDKEWHTYKLRFDWVKNRIYTVVNLPEDLPDHHLLMSKTFILEEMKPVNFYLAQKNLAEIIEMKKPEKIDDFNYLIIYVPLFRYFTIGWVIKWIGISAIMLYLQLKWGAFTYIYEWIAKIAEFLF